MSVGKKAQQGEKRSRGKKGETKRVDLKWLMKDQAYLKKNNEWGRRIPTWVTTDLCKEEGGNSETWLGWGKLRGEKKKLLSTY